MWSIFHPFILSVFCPQKIYRRIRTSAILFIFINSYGFEQTLFFEYHLIDTSRQEIYPHDPAHPFRELMMHVWMPHDTQQQKYPLILFSHGLGQTYNGMTYTYLCQTIAQHGYIIASVSHSYASKPIQFPDGRIATYNFVHRVLYPQDKRSPYDTEVEWWVADMLCALDECEHLFDFSCVAAIGHSLGGATALQLCRRDDRVKAAINLDGPLYGENATVSFDKPVLSIIGTSVIPNQITSLGKVPMHLALNWRQYFNHAWLPRLNTLMMALPQGHTMVIENIVHDTFTDYAFTPDPAIQPWLIDGATAHHAIVGYVCEFLDKYLKR